MDERDHCHRFREDFPDCLCEQESVSALSPGPVGNQELLLRLIFSPIHIDEDSGEVTPAAFSDVADKGLSVSRLQHSSIDEINDKGCQKAANDVANGKSREYLGSIQVRCGDLRNIARDGDRLFCVYDTALADNVAHGDVCQALIEGRSKDKQARKLLREAFTRKPDPAKS